MTGSSFVLPYAQVVDGAGAPLAGAQLFFYAAGSTTAEATYADQALTTANPQPVVADATGTWPAIWLNPSLYRVVLQDVNGTQVWTADNVGSSETGTARTALANQSVFPETWGYSASSQIGGAFGQQSQTTTAPNPGQPATWIESVYTANAPVALDFVGAYLGSIPLGLYVQHVQTGTSTTNNAGTHSIMGYGVNAAAGNNDCVAVSGRVRKENVAGGVGDACGVWGSAYAESTENGGTLGMEAHIYQNVPGMPYEDRLNEKWSVGIHVYSDSTGSPAKAGIGIDASGQTTGRYGFWNGMIIDKNCFAGGNIVGTVGINMGSCDAFNNPQYGIKFGACWGSHIYAQAQNLSISADNSIYLDTVSSSVVPGGSSVFVQLGLGSGSNFVVTGGLPALPILTVATLTQSVLASNFTISEGQAPATSASPGLLGQISWDPSYLYVCVAADSWRRIALEAF